VEWTIFVEALQQRKKYETVENEDLNSDITANRYPSSNPDNHKNRGNMKLNDDE
jgi:hypothetical protein